MTNKVRRLTASKKREFYLDATDTVAPVGGWSGGSRDSFEGLNYATGESVRFHVGDQFAIRAQLQVLPRNTILIQTSIFDGKPGRPVIYHRPEELNEVKKFLEL